MHLPDYGEAEDVSTRGSSAGEENEGVALSRPFATCSSSERSVAGAGVRDSAAISARSVGVMSTVAAASESLSCSTLRAPMIGAVIAGWGDPGDRRADRWRTRLQKPTPGFGDLDHPFVAVARLVHLVCLEPARRPAEILCPTAGPAAAGL